VDGVLSSAVHSGYICTPDSEYAKDSNGKSKRGKGGGGGGGGGGGRGGGGGGGFGGGGGKRAGYAELKEQLSVMHVTDDTIAGLAKEFPHVSARTLRTLAVLDDEKINMDLLEELLQSIVDTTESGAILVFLPGLMEITALYERLMGDTHVFGNPERCKVYPLHSTLSTEEQRSVFNRPPEGVRKVVISTNVRVRLYASVPAFTLLSASSCLAAGSLLWTRLAICLRFGRCVCCGPCTAAVSHQRC
jgi:hypothetical protein